MTPYQQKWMLAVALKRPYPIPETGETTTEITTESTMREKLSGYAETLRNAQTLVWIGGTVVAVLGGLIGYTIGRHTS